MKDKEKDNIICVGVDMDKETEEDKAFYIEYQSGKKFKTKGKLTKETCELIRHLQGEIIIR